MPSARLLGVQVSLLRQGVLSLQPQQGRWPMATSCRVQDPPQVCCTQTGIVNERSSVAIPFLFWGIQPEAGLLALLTLHH